MRLYSGIDIIILCRDWNSLQFEINSYPRGKDSSPGEIPKCPARPPCPLEQGLGNHGRGPAGIPVPAGRWGTLGFGAPQGQAVSGLIAGFFLPQACFLCFYPFFFLKSVKDSSCTQDGDSSPGCPRCCNVCNFCASPWMLSRAEVVSMYIFHP